MGLSPSLGRDDIVLDGDTYSLLEEAGERRWQSRQVASQPGDALAKPFLLSANSGFGASERHMRITGQPSDPGHHATGLNFDCTLESTLKAAPRTTFFDLSTKTKRSRAFRIGGYANSRIGGGRGEVASQYLKRLGPVGYWPLGETSGDALDLGTAGNDLTVNIGSGTRGATALDAVGDGSLTFDNATTTVSDASPAAALDDLFDGGGSLIVSINPNSDGESSFGNIYARGDFSAHYHRLYVTGESGGAMFLNFAHHFSSASGVWQSSSAVIPVGETSIIAVAYDADATTNDPTFYVYNTTNGLLTLTVGNGLTEPETPSGTRTTVSGKRLDIGSDIFGNNTFDGEIDEVALLDHALSAAQAQRYLTLAQAAETEPTAALGGGSPVLTPQQFHQYGDYVYALCGPRTVVFNPDLDTPVAVEGHFHGYAARARSGDLFNGRLAVALGDNVEAEIATTPFTSSRPTAWETASGIQMSVYKRGTAGRLFSAQAEKAFSVLPGNDPATAANYRPSVGEVITDPSDPVKALTEFASALVAGTAKTAKTIDPDRGYQSVSLLPESRLSASEYDGRAMLAVGPQLYHATTEAVNLITLNMPPLSIGPEELENNFSAFKGGEWGIPAYTGKFVAWPCYFPVTGDSVVFLMRRRRQGEPGTGPYAWYDHLYLEDRECRAAYFWGGTADRGPRLFFGAGTAANPMQVGWVDWEEADAQPATSATLTFPMDDFGQPGLTLECERIEFPNVEGADATNYGVWKVKPLGGSFVSLVKSQSGSSQERINSTGFQQVFVPNASIESASGKGLQFQCEITQASAATSFVKFRGNPIAYISARSEKVREVTALLDVKGQRFEDAEVIRARLEALVGEKVLMKHAPGDTDTYVRIEAVQSTEVEVNSGGGNKSDSRWAVQLTFREVAVA